MPALEQLTELLRLLSFMIALWPQFDRDDMELQRNVTFTSSGYEFQMDLNLPADAEAPTPLVMIVHGGMWVGGSKIHYPTLKRYLVQSGIATASIDYGRSLEGGYYRQIVSLKDALRWLRLHAEELNLNTDQFGMFGSSAGGHLSSMAAFCGDGEGFGVDPPGQSSKVQALFLLYGIYDLDDVMPNPLITRMVGGYSPDEAPGLYAFYSPIHHVDGDEPPTYVIHGTDDRLVPDAQARLLVNRLRLAGVPVEYVEVEGGTHGFVRTTPTTRPDIYAQVLLFFRGELF